MDSCILKGYEKIQEDVEHLHGLNAAGVLGGQIPGVQALNQLLRSLVADSALPRERLEVSAR